MIQRRGSALKKHQARLAWLSVRPDLYANVPGIHDDVSDDGRASLDALHSTMKSAGLIGVSTRDVQRETIRRLVSELRGQSVEVPW